MKALPETLSQSQEQTSLPRGFLSENREAKPITSLLTPQQQAQQLHAHT
jgi:hypothetical protein